MENASEIAKFNFYLILVFLGVTVSSVVIRDLYLQISNWIEDEKDKIASIDRELLKYLPNK